MDLQIIFYKAAFSQRGNGFNFTVFVETSKYKYGRDVSTVLRGIVQFILSVAQCHEPVAMKRVKTL